MSLIHALISIIASGLAGFVVGFAAGVVFCDRPHDPRGKL